MSYTDCGRDAQARAHGLHRRLPAATDILCDSFHLSSGYTSIGPGAATSSTGNPREFPEPGRALRPRCFSAAGRGGSAPNIKPWPARRPPAVRRGPRDRRLLICEFRGPPGLGAILGRAWAPMSTSPIRRAAAWGGGARHVPPATCSSWVSTPPGERQTTNSRSSTPRPRWAAMFGARRRLLSTASRCRPSLMLRRLAAGAQLGNHAPGRRPFLVSRGRGRRGLQRYVQTWSGRQRQRLGEPPLEHPPWGWELALQRRSPEQRP